MESSKVVTKSINHALMRLGDAPVSGVPVVALRHNNACICTSMHAASRCCQSLCVTVAVYDRGQQRVLHSRHSRVVLLNTPRARGGLSPRLSCAVSRVARHWHCCRQQFFLAFHAVSNARIQLLDFCREVSEYALDDGSAAAAADLALGLLRKGGKMLDKVPPAHTLAWIALSLA